MKKKKTRHSWSLSTKRPTGHHIYYLQLMYVPPLLLLIQDFRIHKLGMVLLNYGVNKMIVKRQHLNHVSVNFLHLP